MRVAVCIGILMLVLVFFLYYRTSKEGFEGTTFQNASRIGNEYQDRMNSLSISQNPLDNTAAPIGITKDKANKLRNIHSAGLNPPTDIYYGKAPIIQVEKAYDILSPRIDDEDSYLAKIKFCKQAFEKDNDTPFNNTRFKDECGVCMTSGRLATGETFTTPTGVLVYKKDKEIFIKEKTAKNWSYIHAIPSLNSAKCDYATLDDDSRPVLAINQEDYEKYKKRLYCQQNKTLGDSHECGLCLERSTNYKNGTLYSYVPSTIRQNNLRMYVYGEGKATVTVGDKVYTASSTSTKLSSTIALIYNLGNVSEGTNISITVEQNSPTNPAIEMYGYIETTTPIQEEARISLDDFMSMILEHSTSKYAKLGEWMYDDTSNVSMRSFLPGLTSSGTPQTMFTVVGSIPVTTVGVDTLAAEDCPDGPYVTVSSSLSHLDPDECKNPAGQGPGSYTEQCMRKKILEGGCSISGSWYKNPTEIAGSKSASEIKDWIAERSKSKLPGDIVGCTGVNISTPCDDALYNGKKPTKECLKFLYKNQSENTIVGTAYPFVMNKDFTSLENGVVTYCQAVGTENPENPTSSLFLYDTIDDVKRSLSDLFSKATGNLDIKKDDSAGGRKTSWMKCFGINMDKDSTTRSTVVPLDWHKIRNEVEAPYNPSWNTTCEYAECNMIDTDFSYTGSVYIAFVIDVTGSMGGLIENCKNKTISIMSYIQTKFGEGLDIKVGVVAYRDIGDSPMIQQQNFSTVTSAKSFISTLYAGGGGDGPENVPAGLSTTLALSWGEGPKMVFHMADAPCHDYNMVNVENLMKNFASIPIDFYFLRLGSYSDPMTARMGPAYNSVPGHGIFKIMDIGTSEAVFFDTITKCAIASVLRAIE